MSETTAQAIERHDTKALRAIAYTAHCTVEHAISAGGGRSAVRRLEAGGLIERDAEWTGCLVLTAAGASRLEYADGE
ncbi:MAG TPA: hypothetical protein VK586_17865 [Streptosporangiaceae bacterium]|nr:hypothetical protein [Streptosporangiaceae bacterium]